MAGDDDPPHEAFLAMEMLRHVFFLFNREAFRVGKRGGFFNRRFCCYDSCQVCFFTCERKAQFFRRAYLRVFLSRLARLLDASATRENIAKFDNEMFMNLEDFYRKEYRNLTCPCDLLGAERDFYFFMNCMKIMLVLKRNYFYMRRDKKYFEVFDKIMRLEYAANNRDDECNFFEYESINKNLKSAPNEIPRRICSQANCTSGSKYKNAIKLNNFNNSCDCLFH